MAQLGFDATNINPAAPRDIIPEGKYKAIIVASDTKENKARTGSYLELELQVTDGPHSGRKLWDRLNLWNPNTQAAEIAQRTLSAICHSIGRLQVGDSTELHGKPLLVTVKVKPAGKDNMGIDREAQNEVRGYEAAGPAGQFSAGGPGAQYQQAPQQQNLNTSQQAPQQGFTQTQPQTGAAPGQAAPAGGGAPPWRRP